METVKGTLTDFTKEIYKEEAEEILSYLPDMEMDFNKIKTIMINEVVADIPEDDFYSKLENSYYMETTKILFEKADMKIKGIEDILNSGIYITNAIKRPKGDRVIDREEIEKYIPLLEEEISLFSNVKVIMLMGDVAKKAFNIITKKESKKNAIPAISTYKLRNTEIYYNDIRVFPAYIMTGKNILIEKSKIEMSSEDIGKMLKIINREP